MLSIPSAVLKETLCTQVHSKGRSPLQRGGVATLIRWIAGEVGFSPPNLGPISQPVSNPIPTASRKLSIRIDESLELEIAAPAPKHSLALFDRFEASNGGGAL